MAVPFPSFKTDHFFMLFWLDDMVFCVPKQSNLYTLIKNVCDQQIIPLIFSCSVTTVPQYFGCEICNVHGLPFSSENVELHMNCKSHKYMKV